MPESAPEAASGEAVEPIAVDRAALEVLARSALAEITPAATVGALREITVAEDVAAVRFSTTQGGYPGWVWTVSVAVNPGMGPAVLETELMPAEGALVAPDWVPWSDRLEDYLTQQAALGEEVVDDDDDDDSDDDLDDDLDDILDGVDIDEDDGADDDLDDDSILENDAGL